MTDQLILSIALSSVSIICGSVVTIYIKYLDYKQNQKLNEIRKNSEDLQKDFKEYALKNIHSLSLIQKNIESDANIHASLSKYLKKKKKKRKKNKIEQ